MQRHRMRSLARLATVAAALAAVVLGSRASAAPPDEAAASSTRGVAAPFADYHAHIFTVETERQRAPELPAVKVPNEIARLLEERAQLPGGRNAHRDRSALERLYTEEALIFSSNGNVWVKGRAYASRVASLHATLAFWGKPFRLVPLAFSSDAESGFVAGYIETSIGSSARRAGRFHLSLKRSGRQDWQIAAESMSSGSPPVAAGAPVARLIAELDAAGVKKALVLPTSYWWASTILGPSANEHDRVRAENDWVAEQVGRHTDRLVAFCAIPPLAEYALDEIARCAKNPIIKGLKLHIADANVDLMNPRHVEKLGQVFQAANRHKLAIAAHIGTQDVAYGREHARVYIEKIFPMAPDVSIQIAHLAGHGPDHGGDALRAIVEAIEAKEAGTENLFLEVASNVQPSTGPKQLSFIADVIRRVGTERILFGTDRPAGGASFGAKEAWTAFRRLPLTEREFAAIADNKTPYMQ